MSVLFLAELQIGRDPLTRNGDDLAGAYITDKGRSDSGEGTALRGEDIGAASLSKAKRFEAERVSDADQFSRTCNDQSIGSFYF